MDTSTFLTPEKRKDIIARGAARILRNLGKLEGYSRTAYMEKLVAMLDDVHLMALDFSIDMTPDVDEQKS